jgi:hypothetical protein
MPITVFLALISANLLMSIRQRTVSLSRWWPTAVGLPY